MSDDFERERDDWTQRRMIAALVVKQTEVDLLAAIDHLDHDTRSVYADWLEENGELERAEFVRLQDALYRVPRALVERDILTRCREIAWKTDMAWRVLVARPEINNCRRDDCPGDWGSLAPTGLSDVRYCTSCEGCVRYCANEPEMERCKELVAPFVLDVILPARLP